MRVTYPDTNADTVLMWTKRIIVLLGILFLVSTRLFPPPILIGIAAAISFLIALFYHLGFGSLYDQLISILIFFACFIYALLAILVWPIGIVFAGVVLVGTKKLNDKLGQNTTVTRCKS